MGADRLGIYNGALRIVKERKLASLTENVEARRLLDDVFDNGAYAFCLESGQWLFSMRTVAIDYAPTISPPFGYRYAFVKPDDWVRTAAFCSDEFFNVPINQMADEAGYWYTDFIKIYVKFVSSDPAYGFNLSLWPQTFQQFVQAYFAQQIAPRLVQGQVDIDTVNKVYDKALKDALAKDAMNGPTMFPPVGNWAGSRLGRGTAFKSRWNGSPY